MQNTSFQIRQIEIVDLGIRYRKLLVRNSWGRSGRIPSREHFGSRRQRSQEALVTVWYRVLFCAFQLWHFKVKKQFLERHGGKKPPIRIKEKWSIEVKNYFKNNIWDNFFFRNHFQGKKLFQKLFVGHGLLSR